MERSWNFHGKWYDDPEFVRVHEQTLREMSIALPEANRSSQPWLFFVGADITQVYYDVGLCARLGLYCYNFHKGTNYRFRFVNKSYHRGRLPLAKLFITLETCVQLAGFAQNVKTWWETCCKLKGSEEADHEWNYEAINHHYKGEMPNWVSHDEENHQQCYEVQESELLAMDYWWLHLFTEFAFFSKWTGTLNPKTIADSLPLETQKMVVETPGEAAIESREMLKTENAIFYISFSCGDDPATGGIDS